MNQAAIQLIAREITLAGVSPDEEQRLQRLESRRIRPDTELREMEFLFQLQKKPCFARGELVGLSGKAKSGKTFVCSILMALCFRNQLLSVGRNDQRPLHVLWYDTEQSEESTQDILKHRIIPMTGIPEDRFPMERFDIFNVRGEPFTERLPLLETAVAHYSPDLVVLDGIRDLVADINDGVVAQDVVERLMHLASANRCCIVCVLHQNKSAEDRNLRGWIGTELKNKAFEVYECSKSSERIFAWSQTDTRKYDISEQVQFALNEQGIPYLCTQEQLVEAQFNAQRKAADQLQRERHGTTVLPDFNPKYLIRRDGNHHIFDVRLLFSDIMKPGQQYCTEELQKEVYAKANIIRPRVFREVLDQAVAERIVLSSTDHFGKKIYLLPTIQSTVQTTLPFESPP